MNEYDWYEQLPPVVTFMWYLPSFFDDGYWIPIGPHVPIGPNVPQEPQEESIWE